LRRAILEYCDLRELVIPFRGHGATNLGTCAHFLTGRYVSATVRPFTEFTVGAIASRTRFVSSAGF
jgi:hypothetical protein